MAEQKDWIYQARKHLIDLVMKDINLSKDSPELYLRVYYALAKVGLHIKTENLGLLEQED